MGLIGNVIQLPYVGARCVLMSPIAFLQRPRRWLAAISRYRGTTSGGPNFAYDLAVRRIREEDRQGLDLTSWQVAFNGAEPIRADTLERFATAFAPYGFDRRAFFPCYGLAEATLFVAGGPREAPPVVERIDAPALERGEVVAGDAAGPLSRRWVSSGRLWPGHPVRIVDPESAAPCAPGRVGEIWIGGPSVTHGYWNLAEETARAFRAFTTEGDGPFLRTGDLGFLAAGELFVTGRSKDLIILRGRNLYPQDLELTAERSHPALRAGCGAAFAVDGGDEERLVLLQELERGAEGEAAAAAVAIRRALAEEHEVQAHEVVLLRHDTVPKTSSGKIQRHLCRRLYLAGELAAVERSIVQEGELDEATASTVAESWRELPLAERRLWLEAHLAGVLSRLFHQPAAALDPDRPLTSFGLDSLAAIGLQHSLQTGLGVTLELADLLSGPTLRQLAARIVGQPEEAGEPQLSPAPESPGCHPLTHNQRALWFLQRLQPESSAYNVAAAAEVAQPLDAAILRRALALLADRHQALRLSFTESLSGPVQRVEPGREVELLTEDAGGWSPARLDARLQEIAGRPFDLERDPLLRIALFRGLRAWCSWWPTTSWSTSGRWSSCCATWAISIPDCFKASRRRGSPRRRPCNTPISCSGRSGGWQRPARSIGPIGGRRWPGSCRSAPWPPTGRARWSRGSAAARATGIWRPASSTASGRWPRSTAPRSTRPSSPRSEPCSTAMAPARTCSSAPPPPAAWRPGWPRWWGSSSTRSSCARGPRGTSPSASIWSGCGRPLSRRSPIRTTPSRSSSSGCNRGATPAARRSSR